MALPAHMPAHQKEAVLRGESAPFEGKVWGKADLTAEDLALAAMSKVDGNPIGVLTDRAEAAEAKVADLEARIAELEAAHEAKAKKSHKAEPKAEEKAPEKEGE